MSSWVWFPLAGLFVGTVYAVACFVVDRAAVRRWDRKLRDQERAQLRYQTWVRMSRLGGW